MIIRDNSCAWNFGYSPLPQAANYPPCVWWWLFLHILVEWGKWRMYCSGPIRKHCCQYLMDWDKLLV